MATKKWSAPWASQVIASYCDFWSQLGLPQPAESEAWDADRDARRQDSAQRFLEFTRDNGVEYWASVNDIDENPYRYQGKMVAVPFALGRMADATTAIGEGFGWSWGRIFVAGLPRGFFDERTWAVVAGIVQEPETRDVRGGDWTLAVVYSQDALLCAHSDLSGISIFEEGFYRGLIAGEAVLRRRGASFKSSRRNSTGSRSAARARSSRKVSVE